MSVVGRKLAACLLNISEARNVRIVESVAEAAVVPKRATVINIFADNIYNRSVITIAGTLDGLTQGVVSACERAFATIDLRHHDGGHPRMGVVDLIPIHPISEDTTLADCAAITQKIANGIRTTVKTEPDIFFFGEADEQKRSLVQRRKELKWFQSKCGEKSIIGIGATNYMSNFNVTIGTDNLKIGKGIASKLRHRNGGLLGVQSMAFPHGPGLVEIACNVDSLEFQPHDPRHVASKQQGMFEAVRGRVYQTPFHVIESRIAALASEAGCEIRGESVIIGFTAPEAEKRTINAIDNEQAYTKINKVHM